MTRHRIASGRVFLNQYDRECTAAISWSVVVYYNRKEGKAEVCGDFNANKEAQHHHVWKRGHIRPVTRLKRELIKFEVAVDKAFEWVEEQGYDLGYASG